MGQHSIHTCFSITAEPYLERVRTMGVECDWHRLHVLPAQKNELSLAK